MPLAACVTLSFLASAWFVRKSSSSKLAEWGTPSVARALTSQREDVSISACPDSHVLLVPESRAVRVAPTEEGTGPC